MDFSMWQDVYGAYGKYAPDQNDSQTMSDSSNGQYQPNPTIPFLSIIVALVVIRFFQEYTGKTSDI